MTKPYRLDDQDGAERLKQTLRPPQVQILPFNIEAADQYARIRAKNRVLPADALHLAVAAQHGVNLFLTHDRKLHRMVVPGIDFIAGLDVNVL